MNGGSGDVREDWGTRTYLSIHAILYYCQRHIVSLSLHVLHSGAKDTLTELRSKFWITGGRSLVCQLIKKCVICKRYNASYYRPPPPPPLLVYRDKGGLAFTSIGIDYAGPVTIKHYTHTSYHTTHTRTKQQNACTSYEGKAWVCLFTCCTPLQFIWTLSWT